MIVSSTWTGVSYDTYMLLHYQGGPNVHNLGMAQFFYMV